MGGISMKKGFILLIAIGALIGFAIGYALFRFKVLGA